MNKKERLINKLIGLFDSLNTQDIERMISFGISAKKMLPEESEKNYLIQKLVDIIDEEACTLTTIQDWKILNLSNKNLTEISEAIKYLTKLEGLYLNDNKISKIEDLEILINLENLKDLRLFGNPLPEEIIKNPIGYLKGLIEKDDSNN